MYPILSVFRKHGENYRWKIVQVFFNTFIHFFKLNIILLKVVRYLLFKILGVGISDV